jgi:hypothetical protein
MDLWPLDPFESAPMRATSSAIVNSIPYAIPDSLEIKHLSELLFMGTGRNSLLLKFFPCRFFSPGFSALVTCPEYYLAAMLDSGYSTNRFYSNNLGAGLGKAALAALSLLLSNRNIKENLHGKL